ncbi:MAG: hypothetical protein ACKVQU_37205 [Burkholderiales bacterium]
MASNAESVVFDIASSDGVNESERLLTTLCRKSFLRLWAHANLHTDKDLRSGKGSAKELCDALVVFGNDVIIFSDKHVQFQTHKPLEVAWKRWYRGAVQESLRQLYGARSWLQRFPSRVFLDANCSRPLPVSVPDADNARYHLVAVTRGTREASKAIFGGGIGSMIVSTEIIGERHLDSPFMVGLPDPAKGLVHVFDEASLEVIMEELDTTPDFVRDLVERDSFLSVPGRVVYAPGEEELVAAYLRNMTDEGNHCFVVIKAGEPPPDTIVFDGSHYGGLRASVEYRRKKAADKQSYFWDEIVNRFIRIGDPAVNSLGITTDAVDVERALRYLAAEPRFRRRILTNALAGALGKARAGGRVARIARTPGAPDPAYLFLAVPKRDDESYEEYRQHRVALLHAYCRIAKLTAPESSIFVGLAVDHPNKTYLGSSEDLLVWEQRIWDDATKNELERMRAELEIMGPDMVITGLSDQEFPAAPGGVPRFPRDQALAHGKGHGKKKRLEKIRVQSQRRNRKRK